MKWKQWFICIIFSTISNSISCQGFKIILDGGYSYRLFFISDSASTSLAQYQKKKKPGKTLSAEIVWYDSNNGLGIKYSTFLNTVSVTETKLSSLDKIEKTENISIDFYSLQYHKRRQFNKSRLFGEFAVGLGYVRYNSKGKNKYTSVENESEETNDISGKTYGLSTALGFDYKIIKNLYLGLVANLFIANIKEQIRNGYTEILPKTEGLTHLDCCGGLRFSF